MLTTRAGLTLGLQACSQTAAPSPVVWKPAEPVIESTFAVRPRIQPRGRGEREVPFQDVPPGATAGSSVQPSSAPHGGLTGGSELFGSGSGFPAIFQIPWRPPDPTLAVGPEHIVERVNMAIAIYTKTGTQQLYQNLDSGARRWCRAATSTRAARSIPGSRP
jgi:hypothetical protein